MLFERKLHTFAILATLDDEKLTELSIINPTNGASFFLLLNEMAAELTRGAVRKHR
jgi:hypothetical protein